MRGGPSCRPLNVEERALLWRFRYSLTSESRALTKFLKCVDWGDAQEARQAAHLMHSWAPIAIADALELLSPDFSNDQVGVAWGGVQAGGPKGQAFPLWAARLSLKALLFLGCFPFMGCALCMGFGNGV